MCPNLNVKDCINYGLFRSGTYPPGPSTTSKKSDTGFFPGSLLLKCVLDDLFPSNRCTFFITCLQLLISAGRTNIAESHLRNNGKQV